MIDFRENYPHQNPMIMGFYRVLFNKKEYSMNYFYISGDKIEN